MPPKLVSQNKYAFKMVEKYNRYEINLDKNKKFLIIHYYCILFCKFDLLNN